MFLKNFLLSYVLLFCACTSFTHAETDADLMASGQWRDPKTGLIWLKCGVGQKLVGSLCVKSDVNKDSLIKAIKNNIDGDLYSTDDDSYLFTYKQAKQLILYLNNQKLKGSNKWRLPTVFELAALRQCSNYSEGIVEIWQEKRIGSLSFACKDSNIVFPSIFPVKPQAWGWADLPTWTSTPAGVSSKYGNPVSVGWTISTSKGFIQEYKLSASQNVFLVRSE